MAYEIQLDLFASETAEYDQAFSEIMLAVKDRSELVKKEFSDAWIVGAHGELSEFHDLMYCFPEPLLRMGYRYGLKDYDRFSVSGITRSELELVKARVVTRLNLNKRRSKVYTKIKENDLMASNGKPYGTRSGLERYLERNGWAERYCVIQVSDYVKGEGWVARLISEFD